MRLPLVAAVLVAVSPASLARAGDGSAEYPAYGGAESGQTAPPEDDPPHAPGKPERGREPARHRGGGRSPQLELFTVARSRLYLFGRSVQVNFRITAPSPTVNVGLYLTRSEDSAPLRAIELGAHASGLTHSYRLTGREGAPLPEGSYRIRIVARDASGRTLARPRQATAVHDLNVYAHHFPLRGGFSYGDAGARFGAERSGHTHQGQDLLAPEGTPVLAPRGGAVKEVAYQHDGAGHYIVLDGAGERLDYVFMHLQADSTRVREGQRVQAGAQLGNVGNTGRSSGAHLHFEIWQGPWYGGGRPIDPLPSLRRWDRWS